MCHIQQNQINEINFCRVLLGKISFVNERKICKIDAYILYILQQYYTIKKCWKSSFKLLYLLMSYSDVRWLIKYIELTSTSHTAFNTLLKILYQIFILVFHMPAYSNIIRHNTCLLSYTTNSQYFCCYWS